MSAGTDTRDELSATVLARVTEMAYRALRDYGEWRDDIAPDARLDADLGMQSVELAAFQGYLAQEWGGAADLSPLLRTLDLAGLADLSVGTVAGYVTTRLASPHPHPAAQPAPARTEAEARDRVGPGAGAPRGADRAGQQ